MNRDPLETDMGDDDQDDEIREYRRNIEDPPDDLRIRYHEDEDDGAIGIEDELDQEWTARDTRAEDQADDRSAEVAAIEIVDDDDL
ncbi:hypothetical protein [Nocardia implantans]|uniref:DUF5709 domain-containing protein n=1 Tax=Nocardia implantans TaxID=3108168 RepID=A0ABU6B1D3_9NOCA|nr:MULTISPECIES: hypothetical protein [unclassified Nocardia]MBF6195390.1 hypothetical protein [Nocardia beijingensis]MEA3528782.1 hypothetical protein [Nocardia sp. CDC192]MEB3513308.1 hypothetical protein [Nocardia sp. CDC186]